MAELMNTDVMRASAKDNGPKLTEAITSASGFTAPTAREMERRRALRVDMPFPATVRGTDRQGDRFQLETVLDNMSACGLYMKMARQVDVGDKLLVLVRLSLALSDQLGLRVAFDGATVRVEPQADGRYGVAVEFTRHRFLYAA